MGQLQPCTHQFNPLTTKSYIFTQASQNKKLIIFQLRKKIKNTFLEFEFSAQMQNKLENFNKIWQIGNIDLLLFPDP